MDFCSEDTYSWIFWSSRTMTVKMIPNDDAGPSSPGSRDERVRVDQARRVTARDCSRCTASRSICATDLAAQDESAHEAGAHELIV